MEERSFGGERVHEGCDLFGGCGAADFYPIISMTDGSVEAVGWLPLGGYRIGIRSPSGGYFYYAHLSSYERDWKEGRFHKSGRNPWVYGRYRLWQWKVQKENFRYICISGSTFRHRIRREMSVNPYWVLKARSEKNQKVCILVTYLCKNVL